MSKIPTKQPKGTLEGTSLDPARSQSWTTGTRVCQACHTLPHRCWRDDGFETVCLLQASRWDHHYQAICLKSRDSSKYKSTTTTVQPGLGSNFHQVTTLLYWMASSGRHQKLVAHIIYPVLMYWTMGEGEFPSPKERLPTARWCAAPSFVAREENTYTLDAEKHCKMSQLGAQRVIRVMRKTLKHQHNMTRPSMRPVTRRALRHRVDPPLLIPLTQQSCQTTQWLLLLLVAAICLCPLYPVLINFVGHSVRDSDTYSFHVNINIIHFIDPQSRRFV